MIDNLKEYRSDNSGTAMPSGDKQLPVSVRKVPLRELPNETRNIITNSPGSSPLPKDGVHSVDTNVAAKPPGGSLLSKDRGITSDTSRLSGTKRQHADSAANTSSNVGANGHLVYVRRKLEIEPGKVSMSGNTDCSGSSDLKKCSNGGTKELNVVHDLTQVPKTIALPVSAPIPATSLTTSSSEGVAQPDFVKNPLTESSEGVAQPDFVKNPLTESSVAEPDPVVADGVSTRVEPQRSSNLDWRERFFRLQMFLKNCDQASQEDYIRRLRSLSATARSKHAVELEKRAIQLLLEEGKELHRMKVLNVLGKALPKDNMSLSLSSTETPSPSPLRTQFQRDDRDTVKVLFSTSR